MNIYSISDENTDLSISLGLTLAVVETSMGVGVAGISSVGGVSLGHGVEALGDGVKPGARAEGDGGIDRLGITLKQSCADKMRGWTCLSLSTLP